MSDEVTVLLSKEEAALFVLFQQHYDDFAFLLGAQVFEIARGSATLHIAGGKVLNIERKLSTSRDDLPLPV